MAAGWPAEGAVIVFADFASPDEWLFDSCGGDVKFAAGMVFSKPAVGSISRSSPLSFRSCPSAPHLRLRRFLRLALPFVALLCLAKTAPAEDDSDVSAALESARALSGMDPAKARAKLGFVRDLAMHRGRLDLRLAADETECRLLGDMDVSQVPGVVDAGLAAVRAAAFSGGESAAIRLAVLRLRACAADAMFDRGEGTAAIAEVEALLGESANDSSLAPAHALALLERGLHRSRRGNFIQGQEDLLAACSTLEKQREPRDFELCEWHLANHYKRVGDSSEALRLMNRLLGAAEGRGAAFDQAVYAFGIAQVHQARGELAEAMRRYQQSLLIATSLKDESGILYSEHGIGECLVLLGRAGEALPHIERAAALLQRQPDDKRQTLRTSVLLATALAALRRANEAAVILAKVADPVRRYDDDLLLAEWLSAQAETQSQLGRWREAYEALAAWRGNDARLQAQRQSEQSARLRMEFNREKDASDLRALEQVNEQGQRLRAAQALALGMFIALVLLLLVYVGHKVKQSRRLQLLATTDELTSLANRRAILAHLEDGLRLAQSQNKELSLLMIDVDHFKEINDVHGHACGDEALRHLARLLQVNQRTNDRLGRLGGEEFLVVLPDAGAEHATAIAERIRRSVEATPCLCAAGAVRLTVSIGVATMADRAATPATLLAAVDAELYAAKAAGRNVVSCGATR